MGTSNFSHTGNIGGPKRLELVGQRFGMLLVIEKMPSDKITTRFLCRCDCGVEKELVGSEIKRGNWKSCGCNRTPRTTYEYREHPLYDVWKGMKARCSDAHHVSFHSYGGNGVTVCDLWKGDFISFYNWAIENGYQQGLQIDKDIKGDGLLYSPDTCMWVTRARSVQEKASTKLSLEIANEIRRSSLRRIDLSRKYKIATSTVDKIKKNKIWKN